MDKKKKKKGRPIENPSGVPYTGTERKNRLREKQAKLVAERKTEAEKEAKLAAKEAKKEAKLVAERKKEAEKEAKLVAERKKEAEKEAKLAAKEAEKEAKLAARREKDRLRKQRAKMNFTTQQLMTPDRRGKNTRHITPTPATPVVPASLAGINDPTTEYDSMLIDKLLEAQSKKTAANLQAQAAGLQAIQNAENRRYEEAEKAQVMRNQEAEKAQVMRNQEAEKAQVMRNQEAEKAQQLSTKEAKAITDQTIRTNDEQFEPIIGTIVGCLTKSTPHVGESSPFPMNNLLPSHATPKPSCDGSDKKESAGSDKRPPLEKSSSVKSNKRMKCIAEDSPAIQMKIVPRVKAPSSSTTRQLLVVLPDGTTRAVPFALLENMASFSANESHLSILREDGKVFTHFLQDEAPEKDNNDVKPRANALSRLFFSPSKASKPKEKTRKGELEFLDKNEEPVVIRQISSFGPRTMVVGDNGDVFMYGEENDPIRVDNLGFDKKVVEVHTGGTFFIVVLEDSSLHVVPFELADCSMKPGKIALPRGRKIYAIAPGGDHCLLVAYNTSVRNSKKKALCLFTIGNNDCGQLGHGDNKNRTHWNEVLSGLTNADVIDAAAGIGQSFALTCDGNLSFFGAYEGKEAKKPFGIDINVEGDVNFTSIVAAKEYILGLEEAEGFCDSILMLRGGEVQKIGMPEGDDRVIVKVRKMNAGSTQHCFLEVDVALPDDDSALVS